MVLKVFQFEIFVLLLLIPSNFAIQLFKIESRTGMPSAVPTSVPSLYPSLNPTTAPTTVPSQKQYSTRIHSYVDITISSPYIGSQILIPTFSPTRRPSPKFTSRPSTAPSAKPPIAKPPTDKPTTKPTIIPTDMPSVQPTVIPSRLPSPSPTSNPSAVVVVPIPSYSPSRLPILVPTPLPTPSLPIVQFSAGIQLNNAPPTLSPSAQDALIVATAVAMSIPTSAVTYGGLTPVVLKKMEVASALRSEPMIRIDATGISVVANMLGKVVIPLGTSASTYQDTLKNSLQASISSGSFVNNLKGSPLSNSTAILTGFTSTVTYTSPTSPPTRQPTTIRSYGGAIAGLVIMCVVVTGIVAGLIYYCRHKRSPEVAYQSPSAVRLELTVENQNPSSAARQARPTHGSSTGLELVSTSDDFGRGDLVRV